MKKPRKRPMAVALVLFLCLGASLLVALAKTGDSNDETYHANALIDATRVAAGPDANAAFHLETPRYLAQDDMCLDTTNVDPNYDPLSSFDDEILDALRDADPETRIDYDAATGTVTIPDQDASSKIITETPPYVPDDVAIAPTAPVDIPESFAVVDDGSIDTTNADPN